MSFILQPWQLYLVILGGWINRQQQIVIDYPRTENQILKETHGRKRILLNSRLSMRPGNIGDLRKPCCSR